MQSHSRRHLLAATLGVTATVAVALTGVSASAHAQETTTATPTVSAPAIDPDVKTLFDAITAAPSKLTSYSGTVTTTMQSGTGTDAKTTTTQTELSYVLPNKAFARTTGGPKSTTIVSDGKDLITAVDGDTKYIKAAAETGTANVASVVSHSRASASGLMPLLLSGPNGGSILTKMATSLVKAPDETMDGTPVDVLVLDTAKGGKPGFTINFAAGKADHLIRRITFVAGNTTITELYTNIKANPTIDASTFTFVPKPGMIATVPPPPPPMFDPSIKAGAAPIAFTAVDIDGKPQDIASYKGKVLLLDFWATWCGPCRAEMPNVIANYSKFHDQGFDIVGISLDQKDSRDKVVGFTKTNKMPWPQIYDGKYWEAEIAKKYGVQAIPFSVLIGKDGKIIAVNPRGEALEPALKGALAK